MRLNLVGDATIYTLSNFAVAGVPFLLLPILTRVLSPEEYGLVAMFGVVVTFMSVGVGLNLHGAIMVRFFDRGNFDIPTYISTCLLLVAVATLTMCGVVLIWGAALTQLTSLPIGWLLLTPIVAGLQFLVQIHLTLWQSSRQPLKYGLLRLSQAGMDGLVSVCFVVVLAWSWQGRVGGLALASLATALCASYLMVRGGWIAKSVSSGCARDALRYGVPLVPHALGGLLLGIADRFMITNYLDVGSTGVYMVASQLGLILGIAADAFNRAFAPWLMEALQHQDVERDRRIVRYTYGYFVAILSVALIAGELAPELLGVLVGAQYQEASSPARYILIGNAFVGMYYMVTNYVFLARRTELLSALTITVGIVTVALSWYLIKLEGMVGAAQAFMIGQMIMFFGTWGLAHHCHKMPWAPKMLFRQSPV